jgi:hypothetical protein
MTAAYKKRAKGGWCGGKSHKEESNRGERNYEDKEIQEQLEETSKVRKAVKKTYSDKDINRTLSKMRWIHKFSHGNVENLNKKDPNARGDWFQSIRQEYYQEYKKLLPEVTKLLERQDLPAKVRRQVIEVLTLFNVTI